MLSLRLLACSAVGIGCLLPLACGAILDTNSYEVGEAGVLRDPRTGEIINPGGGNGNQGNGAGGNVDSGPKCFDGVFGLGIDLPIKWETTGLIEGNPSAPAYGFAKLQFAQTNTMLQITGQVCGI